MTLTPEEITATGDMGLIASYRQSRLTQLMKANTKIPGNELFINDIKALYNKFIGSENAYDTFASQISQSAEGRTLSPMELALRATREMVNEVPGRPYDQEIAIKAKSVFESFYQRTQVSSLSDKSQLGTYVNRLGWAVSSEEQRVTAINQFKTFAESTGDARLQEFANNLAARASFVFNPESAIDVAVGAKVFQTMGATYKELYDAFIVASEGAFSKDVVELALGKALLSLTGNSDEAIRTMIREYSSMPGAKNISSMSEGEVFNFLLSGEAGDDLARRAFSLIDISAKNVGEQLIAATGKEVGTLGALQSLYGEAFEGIGNIGIDPVATRLKLSSIIEKSSGDVPTLINSIAEGITETFSGLGYSNQQMNEYLEQSPMLRSILSLNTSLKLEEKVTTKTAAKYKEELIDILGYKGTAEKYAVPTVDDIIAPAREKIVQAKRKLREIKYNRYAGSGDSIRDIYKTQELSDLMENIKSNIASGFTNADTVGFSAEDLEMQNRLYQVLKKDGITKYDLQKVVRGESGNALLASLRTQGIINEEMAQLITSSDLTSADVDKITQRLIGVLEVNRAAAKISVRQAVQNMFEQNTLAREAGISGTPDATALMHRMMIEMVDMKNATQTAQPNKTQRVTSMIGSMIEEVLFDATNPISIGVGATTPQFTLQQLTQYVHTSIEEGFTRSVADRTESMINLVKTLGEGEIIPTGENVLSKQNIGRALKVDRASALDAETGVLRSIPKLQNREAVEQAIAGGNLDVEFIEDLMAMANEDSARVEALIRQRIESEMEALPGDDLAERFTSIEVALRERVRQLKLTLQRGSVIAYQETDEYRAFLNLIVGDEAMGTTGLTGERTSIGMQTIEDLIDSNLKYLTIEDEDIINEVAQTFADTPKAAPAKFTRVQDLIKSPQARKAYEALLKNKGKVSAVAALATGIAVFASRKNKDHTEDAITGPPLLPGGNPYERMPRTPMAMDDPTFANPTMGSSYNVSINADREKTEEFMARAGLLNNGQVSGTMHNSIPTLGRDPYADIAGSF